MSDEIKPGTPSLGVSQSKTNWRPIGLTILSAFLLAAGSCFGAITSVGNTAETVFSVAFIIAVLALVLVSIWAFITWVESR